MRTGFIPLTKENQRHRANIVNKHGRKAWIRTINWFDRGCWVYFKNRKNGGQVGDLIEYCDFHNWFIQI